MLTIFILIAIAIVLFWLNRSLDRKSSSIFVVERAALGGSIKEYTFTPKEVNVNQAFIQRLERENLLPVSVIGNSMSPNGINDTDIVAVKMTDDIDSLSSGDVIYLKIQNTQQTGDFKLREFKEFKDNKILSYTYNALKTPKPSKHDPSTLIGKVVSFTSIV